jgi:hypothetical protein
MANLCKAINRDGQPCGAYALSGSDYCFMHDPSQAAKRAEARKLGGQRQRANHSGAVCPVTVQNMGDVLALLDYSLAESLRLENSLARGRLLVSLAGAYIEALQVGELEARIEALESVLLKRGDR